MKGKVKFEITALNPMQEEAGKIIRLKSDVVLLSPTGTGKTLLARTIAKMLHLFM